MGCSGCSDPSSRVPGWPSPHSLLVEMETERGDIKGEEGEGEKEEEERGMKLVRKKKLEVLV